MGVERIEERVPGVGVVGGLTALGEHIDRRLSGLEGRVGALESGTPNLVAYEALRDKVEILQARVKDDEEQMLARLANLETIVLRHITCDRCSHNEPTYPADTKLTVVEKTELAAMRAVVEAAVAYADRHMTGMGALSSTGIVTDQTRALWKSVGDYRKLTQAEED